MVSLASNLPLGDECKPIYKLEMSSLLNIWLFTQMRGNPSSLVAIYFFFNGGWCFPLTETIFAENIGAVRELSKVTDSLGQRIEELESHTVRMTKLKRSV
jgi:hypothetical protein